MRHEEFLLMIDNIIRLIDRDVQTDNSITYYGYSVPVIKRAIHTAIDLEAAYTEAELVGQNIASNREDVMEFLRTSNVPYMPFGELSIEEFYTNTDVLPEEIDLLSVDTTELPNNSNLGGGYGAVGTTQQLAWFIAVLKGNNPNGWRVFTAEQHGTVDRDRGAWHLIFVDRFGRSKSFWITNVWYNLFCSVESLGLEPIELPSVIEIIPSNPDSIMVSETTSRFSGAIWYEEIQKQSITLAGVGGIGSYIGFLLARMRPYSLYIYDPDSVEAVNMSGQLYGFADIGLPKVTALSRMLHNYANYSAVDAYVSRYHEDSEATNIMICGFDNMAARQTFFSKWLEHVANTPVEDRHKCLFIDGRLAAEEFQVLTVQGDDVRAITEYQGKWLFTDEQADATVCSYKQTTFMANMIASVMVNTFVNFVANLCEPIFPRDIPFVVSYDASTMFFKTEM